MGLATLTFFALAYGLSRLQAGVTFYAGVVLGLASLELLRLYSGTEAGLADPSFFSVSREAADRYAADYLAAILLLLRTGCPGSLGAAALLDEARRFGTVVVVVLPFSFSGEADCS